MPRELLCCKETALAVDETVPAGYALAASLYASLGTMMTRHWLLLTVTVSGCGMSVKKLMAPKMSPGNARDDIKDRFSASSLKFCN